MLAQAVLGALAPVTARPIESREIYVIDGETIDADGQRYRLVGFDTPETKDRAQCEAERTLGARAIVRLRQLVAGGGLDL